MSSRLLSIAAAVFMVVSYPVLASASYTSAVVGTTATMTGDASGDTLLIDSTGGLFRHNRFGADAGFNSPIDFDTTLAGDQTLSASTDTININAGGGSDIIVFGDAINIRGAIDGGSEVDTLNYGNYTTTVRANLGLGTTGLNATLGNDQEVAPTTHAGTGTANITNYDVTTRTFNIVVTVSDLPPADVTGFHIHQAAVGVNGPIIVDFGAGPLVPAGTGFTFTAVGLTLPPGNEAAFLGGGTYVNVHTAAFPGGAIRGQLFSAANVNLPSGVATGTSSISNVENVVGGSAADSLVGSFVANVLFGAGGNDWIVGGPGADQQFGDAGSDVLVWSNGDGSDINEGGADLDIVNVNGNTTNSDVFLVQPNGVRLRFDRTNVGLFNLDNGTVETLIVNGIGGDDTFNLNDLTGVASLTTVNFNGLGDNDTFFPTTTTGGISVNAVGGTNTGSAPLGDKLNMAAFTSAVRVNLGLGTTGLSATLGSDQENPPTTHAGTATATISNYSVTTRTFDINVAVSDFPPADVTGFHIHQGVVGVNGPIIVDFSGVAPLVAAGTGFTFTAAGLTLPSGSEAAFLGGGTYVNIHTAAFPAGAIRGQIFSNGNQNLTSGVATGISSVVGVENVTGGTGDDSLVGSFTNNEIFGGAGNDWIVGGPFPDALVGDAGNDVMVWSNGDGSDFIEGGADTDGVNVNGNVLNPDVFVVQPNGARLRFERTSAGPFTLDIGTVEGLIVNGVGGDDTFTVNDLAGIASLTTVNLNGLSNNDVFSLSPSASTVNVNTVGGINTAPGDTLNMSAFTSPVRVNLGLGTTGLAATLGNDQENPPTTHAGTGTATITNYNVATRTFDITVTVSNLPPGEVTGFHIHQATVGVNGPIIVDFTGVAPLVPVGSGFTFTAAGLTLPAASEAAFLGGGTYVNVHTAAFPGGAIRGQIFSGGNANLTTGAATGASSVVGIENVTGGSGGDSLVGSSAANVIAGGAGNDWIVGGPGADTQSGEAGNDVIVWSNGDGSDLNEGGADSDLVNVNGSLGAAGDLFIVQPNGARLRFDRTNLGVFNLDIGTVETLTVNGVSGGDAFHVFGVAGIASLSTINLNGFNDDDSFSFQPASLGSVVANVHGGPGSDTLQGPAAAAVWTVTAASQGNISAVTAFRFVEQLLGNTAADAFFVKAFPTAPLAVTGGAGTDTLSYDSESRAISGDLTPPDGVIDSPGVLSLPFTEIENVSFVNPQPTVSISDVTVAEAPATTAVFNVSLSQASLVTVTVNAATANGTAIAPGDYTAVNTPVTFAPGEILKTVSVPITVDAVAEPTETFVVNLSAPVNVAISDAVGVGTIVENTPPTISAIANVAVNANTATGAIAFTVSDPESAAASLTVSATSSNTTLVPNANIVIGGSGSSRTVTVTPAFNQIGTTTITLTVSDGALTASTSFVLTVNNLTTAQPPTALVAASIVGNSVTFRWSKPALGPAPTGFVVEGGINPGEVLASLATGSSDPIFTVVAPTGAFYARVHTLVGNLRSAASNEIRVFVNMPVAPSAPTDLVATVNGSSLTLAWRHTFTGGSPDNQVLDVLGPASTSIPLGPTQTATFPGVPAGTYNLAVRSTNGSGSSAASNSITVGVPGACSGAPLPPSNFLAYKVGNQVSVIWELSSLGPAPSSFVVQVTGTFNLALPTPARSASGTVPAGTYNLSVSAVNSCGTSAPTPVQTVIVP